MPRTYKVGSSFWSKGKKKIVKGIKNGRLVVETHTKVSAYEMRITESYHEIKEIKEVWDKNKAMMVKQYQIANLTRGKRTRYEQYEYLGTDRLSNGFQSLMNMCSVDGGNQTLIEKAKMNWSQLTSSEQGAVFNAYNKREGAQSFGSSSFDMTATFQLDADDYLHALLKSIKDVIGADRYIP